MLIDVCLMVNVAQSRSLFFCEVFFLIVCISCHFSLLSNPTFLFSFFRLSGVDGMCRSVIVCAKITFFFRHRSYMQYCLAKNLSLTFPLP